MPEITDTKVPETSNTLKDVLTNFSQDSKELKNEVLQNSNLIESFTDYLKKTYSEKTIIKAFDLDGNIDHL